MSFEQYSIVYAEEYGYGVILQAHTHYSMIEFERYGHAWQVLLENDEFVVVDQINIEHKEIT
jgi:hypothetical protein